MRFFDPANFHLPLRQSQRKEIGVTNAISIGGAIVIASAAAAFYSRRRAGFTIQHAPAE